DLARVAYGKKFLCKPQRSRIPCEGLADERNGTLCHGASERAEHRPVVFRLRIWNGSVGIAHDGGCNHSAFENQCWLDAEEGRTPDAEIGEFSDFNRAYVA